MRYKKVGSTFFHYVTIHAFVRQTDRQTDGRTNGVFVAIPCVALHAAAWY